MLPRSRRSRVSSADFPAARPTRRRPRSPDPMTDLADAAASNTGPTTAAPRRDPADAPTDGPAAATDIPTFGHFIGGEWVTSTSGATFDSRNPADHRDVIA